MPRLLAVVVARLLTNTNASAPYDVGPIGVVSGLSHTGEAPLEMPATPIQVYIVDDEPSVRVAFARLVRSANMTAHMFASVDEFMKSNARDENACVVSDEQMPGCGGLELLGLLARAHRMLPVIILTANDTPEMRHMAQRLGAAAYIRKPVDGETLLEAISSALVKA